MGWGGEDGIEGEEWERRWWGGGRVVFWRGGVVGVVAGRLY